MYVSAVILALLLVPPETCFQLVPPANVVTGVNLLVDDVLFPISPEPLLPQTHKFPCLKGSAGTKTSSKL